MHHARRVLALSAALAGAPAAAVPAAAAQAPARSSDYRGVWFGIAVAGAYARARCEQLCESGSGVSAAYSAAIGAAVAPRVLVGVDAEIENPFCADCTDDIPLLFTGAATVRVRLAPSLALTGDGGVVPVARVGLGGYAYQSGNASGPPGSASGLALVAGLAFDIPLDSARRRFTRIGSIAPFISYTHALSGKIEPLDDQFGPPIDRESLRLDAIHIGLAVIWH